MASAPKKPKASNPTSPPETPGYHVPYEIWTSRQANKLLNGRHICVLGDSIQRMAYKDLVRFLTTNKLIPEPELRRKMEPRFNTKYHADRLVDSSEAHNGTHYYEIREWKSPDENTRVTFFFITRLYSKFVQETVLDFFNDPENKGRPDVWFVNSTVWDISRFGESSVKEYYANLRYFFEECLSVLTPDGKQPYIVWRNAMPISDNARGGFLIPSQKVGEKEGFRLDIPGANKLAVEHLNSQLNIELMDIHNYSTDYMEMELQGDGIHWSPKMHRVITMLLLTKIRRYYGYARLPAYFVKHMVGPNTNEARRQQNIKRILSTDITTHCDRQGDKLWSEVFLGND